VSSVAECAVNAAGAVEGMEEAAIAAVWCAADSAGVVGLCSVGTVEDAALRPAATTPGSTTARERDKNTPRLLLPVLLPPCAEGEDEEDITEAASTTIAVILCVSPIDPLGFAATAGELLLRMDLGRYPEE
jgi:hypothetical protein